MIRYLAHKGIPTVCPLHGGGVIDSPDRDVLVGGAGLHAAATGDLCNCPGAPNTIMAGATNILVKGLPAAGLMHVTAHNPGPPDAPTAAVLWGSSQVLMGGGMTVGAVAAATAECMFLPANRVNQKPTQSGANCGVESMRQMINAQRRRQGEGPLSEDALLDETLKNGESSVTVTTADQWDATLIQKDREMQPYRDRLKAAKAAFEASKGVFSTGDAALAKEQQKAQREYNDASNRILVNRADGASLGADVDIERQAREARERQKQRAESARATPDYKDPNRAQAGGTLPDQQRDVLGRYGILTREMSQDVTSPEDMKELENAVAHGHGVLVGVDSRELWNIPSHLPAGGHAILITAVAYDENGEVTGYVTNDTVMGCGRPVTRSQLRASLRPDLKATVTRDPIW